MAIATTTTSCKLSFIYFKDPYDELAVLPPPLQARIYIYTFIVRRRKKNKNRKKLCTQFVSFVSPLRSVILLNGSADKARDYVFNGRYLLYRSSIDKVGDGVCIYSTGK